MSPEKLNQGGEDADHGIGPGVDRYIFWSRLLGSPPKRCFHRPELSRTVALAPGLSFACEKSRPRPGCTPSVRSKFQENSAMASFSGSCLTDPESPTRLSRTSARLLKLWFCFFHSA